MRVNFKQTTAKGIFTKSFYSFLFVEFSFNLEFPKNIKIQRVIIKNLMQTQNNFKSIFLYNDEESYMKMKLQQAGKLFQQERIVQAIAMYKQCIEMNPNYSGRRFYGLGCNSKSEGFYQDRILEWFFQQKACGNIDGSAFDSLSLLYQINEEYDQGRAWYNSILQKYPSSFQLHYGLANLEFNDAKFSQARIHYEQAAKLRPEFARAYLGVAFVIAEEQTKRAEAFEWINRTLQLDPQNIYGQYLYALCQNHVKTRIELLEKIAKKGSISKIYVLLGNAYVDNQQTQKGIEYYQLALKLSPQRGFIHLNIGYVHLNKGMYDEAAEQFHKVLKLEQNCHVAFWALGQIQFHRKKYDKAIQFYENALKKNDKHFNSYEGLAKSYLQMDKEDEAICVLEKCIAFNDNSPNYYYLLGKAYCFKDQYQDSNKYFLKCIEIDHKYIPAYKRILKNHYWSHQYNKVLQWYENCLQVFSPEEEFSSRDFAFIGESLQSFKRYDESLTFYLKAVKKGCKNSWFYKCLLDLYMLMDRLADAGEALQQMEELIKNDQKLTRKHRKAILQRLKELEKCGNIWQNNSPFGYRSLKSKLKNEVLKRRFYNQIRKLFKFDEEN